MGDRRSAFSFLVAVALLSLAIAGCTGTVTRRPVDDEVIKTTDTTEVDLRTMCEKMARSLIELPQVAQAKSPPTIAFLEMQNRTLQDVDSYNLLSSIRKKLIEHSGGKFMFLDREAVEELKEERRMKRTGQVTSSSEDNLRGVDFFLSGRAYSTERRYKGVREVYYRYSFRLTHAETSGIVWEDDYEFKKAAKEGFSRR